MKHILFVVCTHGNELAPFQIFLRHPYGRTKHVEWEVIVGNWKAVFLNTRFIDIDLNRAFDRETYVDESKNWELYLARELKKRIQSKSCDVLYDIHTTDGIKPATWPDCLFINRIDRENLDACQYLRAKNVVWDSDLGYNKQYLTSVHPVGITVEYQKTASYEFDVKRILNDFWNIVNQKISIQTKHISGR